MFVSTFPSPPLNNSSSFFKDKSEYFRWGLLMYVPIAGNGSFDGTKDKLANGEETMKIEVTEKVNLLT